MTISAFANVIIAFSNVIIAFGACQIATKFFHD